MKCDVLSAKMRQLAAGVPLRRFRVGEPTDPRDARIAELERALRDTLRAMEQWGSWEDGIPDGPQWDAYVAARRVLGIPTDDMSEEPIPFIDATPEPKP